MIRSVARGLILAFVFSVIAQAGFLLTPSSALVWIAVVTAAFLWLHLRSPRARARLRLRALKRADVRRTLLAAPAVIALGVGLIGVLEAVAGPFEMPDIFTDDGVLGRYTATWTGWAVFALYAGVSAPIIEEASFRGWVQRPLERRFGTTPAIVAAAAVFGLYHLWYGYLVLLLVPFALGVAWGAAVVRTRSLWSSVILHGVWNGAVLVAGRVSVEEPPEGTGSGLIPAAVLLAIGIWGLAKLLRSETARA